ncbi:PP2C family serine/threonine-protein phosphatase [Polyangium aurulentum]|uniref:PP2C family serine/threonine-protein phosphatase n=1 Tax=Polyangium aurulentum TaxID=2567896 RepID=UPI0010AE1420|nr:PP2C family serine/threonine-protein phosphatase [Polyangium aurulentum]UQA56236.1 protein phosphatase 2C domain-containing protein [Polyangium aurulentum]
MPLWTAIALALGLVLAGGLTFQLTRPKTRRRDAELGPDAEEPLPEALPVATERNSDPRLANRTSSPERSSAPESRRSSLPRVEELQEDSDADLTLITIRSSLPSLREVEEAGSREERAPVSATAVPIVVDDDAAADEPTRASPFILVSAAGQTDQGKRRKNNEDSYLVLDEHGLFVVADGMGGYAGGEVASALAVETIEKAFRTQQFDGAPYPNVPRRGSELSRSIQMANKTIYERAHGDPSLKGMGTTVVAARFSLNKQRLYVGHVGDSRCYRLRNGEMKQITTDHTMAALGFTAAAFANRLNRAVGTSPSVEIDLIIGRPEPNDTYLLCSDGLSKMVPDAELQEILIASKHPKDALAALIERANQKGGHDNITVILVSVRSPAEYIKSLQS